MQQESQYDQVQSSNNFQQYKLIGFLKQLRQIQETGRPTNSNLTKTFLAVKQYFDRQTISINRRRLKFIKQFLLSQNNSLYEYSLAVIVTIAKDDQKQLWKIIKRTYYNSISIGEMAQEVLEKTAPFVDKFCEGLSMKQEFNVSSLMNRLSQIDIDAQLTWKNQQRSSNQSRQSLEHEKQKQKQKQKRKNRMFEYQVQSDSYIYAGSKNTKLQIKYIIDKMNKLLVQLNFTKKENIQYIKKFEKEMKQYKQFMKEIIRIISMKYQNLLSKQRKDLSVHKQLELESKECKIEQKQEKRKIRNNQQINQKIQNYNPEIFPKIQVRNQSCQAQQNIKKLNQSCQTYQVQRTMVSEGCQIKILEPTQAMQNLQKIPHKNIHTLSLFNGNILNGFKPIHIPEDNGFNPDLVSQLHSYKNILVNYIEQFSQLRIKSTKICYHYDELSSNFNKVHQYIDQKPHFVVLIQLKISKNGIHNIIGAYSQQPLKKQGNNQKGDGFLFSLTNQKIYQVDRKVYGSHFMNYHPYHMIFGNSDIKIQFGKKQVHSNFGTPRSFFKPKESLQNLFGCDEKVVEFQQYEVHQLFF